MRSFFAKRLRPRAFARSESGTQLVELAIVLPVLLVLFGAAAEFGRFFYTYQTLAKSTRSSARFLTTKAVEGPDGDTIATNLAVYGNTDGSGDPLVHGLGPEHVAIVREGGVGTNYERVRVQIQDFEYQPLFDIGGFFGDATLSLNVNVSPSTTMRYF